MSTQELKQLALDQQHFNARLMRECEAAEKERDEARAALANLEAVVAAARELGMSIEPRPSPLTWALRNERALQAEADCAAMRVSLTDTRDALRAEIAMPHTCSDCGWNVGGVPKGLHGPGCRVANAADRAMYALDGTDGAELLAAVKLAHDEWRKFFPCGRRSIDGLTCERGPGHSGFHASADGAYINWPDSEGVGWDSLPPALTALVRWAT